MKLYKSGNVIEELDLVVLNYESCSCVGWTGYVVSIGDVYVRVKLFKNRLGEIPHFEMDLLPSMLTLAFEWVFFRTR